MQIRRRLQLGAAVVIANGLIAMSLMSPDVALANPCTAKRYCGGCPTLSICQSIANPGCTATSVGGCGSPFPGCGTLGAFCFYN
jgi:hypothetical protein